MYEVKQTSDSIALAISDIVNALSRTVEAVLWEINQELTAYIKVVSSVVSLNIAALLDDIFDLYSYEWAMVWQRERELSNLIDYLMVGEAQGINNILSNFDKTIDILISKFEEQLTQIDTSINPYYNERMFAIYSSIAEFSMAIDVPPFYLEGVIQNARSLAMAIACSAGLPYYQFQWEWDANIRTLLIHIQNSTALYRRNPQWIKVDIEEILIKPMYETEMTARRQEKEQLISFNDTIIALENLLFEYKLQSDENKQIIESMYELKIAPALKELADAFDTWKKDIYESDRKSLAKSYAIITIGINTVFGKVAEVLGLLDYGGDLLLRIDKLSFGLRVEQENKVAAVVNRRDKRVTTAWMEEVATHL